jgi:hypothetical protein
MFHHIHDGAISVYAVHAKWTESRFDLSNIAGNAAIMRITAKDSTNENEIVRYSNSDILSLNDTLPTAIENRFQSSFKPSG